VTSEEMLVLDENAEWIGVSRLMLMENAGRAVAERVAEALGSVKGRKILILCGSGNNGGDGFAAARHLALMGAEVKVLLLTSPEKIRTEEARKNYRAVESMRLSIKLKSITSSEELYRYTAFFDEAEAVVDAILGTGAKGGLSGVYRAAVELANNSKALKVSIDIPTGLDPDTGTGDFWFQADLTVALHRPKPANLQHQGRYVVESIGLPYEAGVIAGPGQLKLMVLKTGLQKIFNSRVACVFGGEGPESRLREFLTSLKGSTIFCDINMLVENPEIRYAVASSRAALITGEVNPNNVKAFLPRSQPMVLTTIAAAGVNPVYVLWSEKTVGEEFTSQYHTLVRDVEELCRKLAAPVYVVGEVDALSNGVKTYVNWMGRSLRPQHYRLAQALIAWFLGGGCDPLLAAASTSYLLRSAEPSELENPPALAESILSKLSLMA